MTKDDLISRQAAIYVASGYCHPANIAKELEKLPSAQPEQPIRCKDCLYWQDNNGGYPHEDCKWNKDETPYADDFCSGAVRKKGEADG